MLRFVLIAWLALCGVANAQLSGGVGGFPGPGTVHSVGGVTCSSSEGNAFLARLTGSPDNTHKTRYCTLIDGLVTDAVFAKLDVLYIFATDTAANALLNLKSSSFNGTVVGALTFTADTGYTGTGATNYINTGFNPTAAAGNYARDSGSIGIYVLNNRTTDQGYVNAGTATGAGFSFIAPKNATAVTKYAINTAAPKSIAATTAQGQWITSRTGATTTALQRNGAAFDTDTSASVVMDNSNIYIFAYNTGVPAAFSLDQQSAVLIGGGLTGTEMTNLAGRINTYMTAYSINVY